MNHDPLCIVSGMDTFRPTSWEPEMCICDVIAKVRDDERQRASMRIARLPTKRINHECDACGSDKSYSVCNYSDAISAALEKP